MGIVPDKALDMVLPYAVAIWLWARCFSFIRKHGVDLSSITTRGLRHLLAFPFVCVVTPVTLAVLGAVAGKEGIELRADLYVTLLHQLAMYALNLYLGYVFVFHGMWVVVGVFGSRGGSEVVAGLRRAFEQQQKYKWFVWVAFLSIAAMFMIPSLGVTVTLLRTAWTLP